MAGVKLTPDARARLKLLAGFYRLYYPNDKIDRNTVLDWAISNFAPLDLDVVWNGKNYALQCRACGYVAVRPATMNRHLREGCESTEPTLDIGAQAAEKNARNVEPRVLAQPEGPDESVLDIAAEPTLEPVAESSLVLCAAEDAERPRSRSGR